MSEVLNKIKESAKKNGIDAGEDALRALVKDCFDIASEEALKSENDLIKMVAAVLPMVKKPVIDFIDGLDGEKEEE